MLSMTLPIPMTYDTIISAHKENKVLLPAKRIIVGFHPILEAGHVYFNTLRVVLDLLWSLWF